MSAHELWLSDLIGRKVRDASGRSVGRIEELVAEIELHEQGNDYVVTEFHVGTFGALEGLAGNVFAQHMAHKLGRLVGYRRCRVRWDQIDISDPAHPRITVPREELQDD